MRFSKYSTTENKYIVVYYSPEFVHYSIRNDTTLFSVHTNITYWFLHRNWTFSSLSILISVLKSNNQAFIFSHLLKKKKNKKPIVFCQNLFDYLFIYRFWHLNPTFTYTYYKKEQFWISFEFFTDAPIHTHIHTDTHEAQFMILMISVFLSLLLLLLHMFVFCSKFCGIIFSSSAWITISMQPIGTTEELIISFCAINFVWKWSRIIWSIYIGFVTYLY